MKGANANPFELIDSIETTNSKQAFLLNDIRNKLKNLTTNKRLITNNLLPTAKNLSSSMSASKIKKISNSSLKIESDLRSNISSLEKLSKLKYSLLEREVVALNQFNSSLEDYYSLLRPLVIRGNIKQTIAENKIETITKNIIHSIKNIEHAINLAMHSKKLCTKLINSIIVKKNISEEQIEILKNYSSLSIENIKKNVTNINKTKEKLIDTSSILSDLKEQLELEIIQPMQDLHHTKLKLSKNSFSFFKPPSFFSKAQVKLKKSDVLKDMKSFYSEKELKTYLQELKPCINLGVMDNEVEVFIIKQLENYKTKTQL